MNKMPPIEKIYEAYSAISDNRVVMDKDSAKVESSNRTKEYIVTWKGGIYTSKSLSLQPPEVSIGGRSEIQYEVAVRDGEPVHIRVEYGIYFVKAGGNTSRKSFLLSDKTVPSGAHLTGTRRHNWSEMTTRRHYPGDHRIVLLVNGREMAEATLSLLPNK